MPQLTMKALDERLTALETYAENAEAWAQNAAIGLDELFERTEGFETADTIPAWGLEIIEALIEALHGVRLAGAQVFELALKAKYFPAEEVEGDETATI